MFVILLSANRSEDSTDTFVTSITADVSLVSLCLDVPLVVDTLEGPGLLDAVLPGARPPGLEAGAGVASVYVCVLLPHAVRTSLVINTFVSGVSSYRNLLVIL